MIKKILFKKEGNSPEEETLEEVEGEEEEEENEDDDENDSEDDDDDDDEEEEEEEENEDDDENDSEDDDDDDDDDDDEEEEEEEEDDEDDDDDDEEEEEEDDEDDDNDEKTRNKNTKTAPELKEKSWLKKDGELAVDIYETKEDIVIMAPIGGTTRDEIEIITEKDMIIIKGNRERKEKAEIKNFYSKECFFGPFSREIILPEETDPSRIKANLENGVLVIRAPKIEREKRRKIDI